jgi:hypothetical protein
VSDEGPKNPVPNESLPVQTPPRKSADILGLKDVPYTNTSNKQQARLRSANDETLFVEDRSVFGSDLNPPVPCVFSRHRATAVRAISASRTGLNAKLH